MCYLTLEARRSPGLAKSLGAPVITTEAQRSFTRGWHFTVGTGYSIRTVVSRNRLWYAEREEAPLGSRFCYFGASGQWSRRKTGATCVFPT